MSVIGVLAHFGGNPNDWWIELGLPVVILVALYVWSTRGERRTRKDAERRQKIGETTDYRDLSDEDLCALLAVGGGSPTPEAQRLRADARAELERRRRAGLMPTHYLRCAQADYSNPRHRRASCGVQVVERVRSAFT